MEKNIFSQKNLISFYCFFISFFITLPLLAQETPSKSITFVPLDNRGIEGFTDKATASSLSELLNTIYQVMISVASVLAVVMIFYAGFSYAVSSNGDGRSRAKNRIISALGGLALALSSWLILSTIDEDLINNDIFFTEFVNQQIEIDVLTAQGRASLEEKYNTVFTYSIENGHQISNPGTLLTGGGSVAGIPLKGQINQTLKNDEAHRQRGYTTGEELWNESVSFQGNTWVKGRASWFGSSADTTGVTSTETGSITGEILRGLSPTRRGVAVRWDYSQTSRSELRGKTVIIYSPDTGKTSTAQPIDWGPHLRTKRAIDVTPQVMEDLGFGRSGGTDKVLYFRFAE